MRYSRVTEGVFLSRPNRFIAKVLVNGREETVHVKNTGRCRELLIPGTRVLLSESENPARKTRFDLITVEKGSRLVNLDSQAPNRVFGEWVTESGFFPGVLRAQGEYTYGDSRLDYCLHTEQGNCLVEIKGVTLEEDGIARFPDAPTERGARHLRELFRAKQEGLEAAAFFVIQMKGVRELRPNDRTDPAFAAALREAEEAGVRILAYDCVVTEDTLIIDRPVPVIL